ncbi:beta-phosphoglucomutase [Siccibacter turicensis]|uniref:beta-phosphoglucomutase n=1 Tax=Siccibacter turicensis TaxID=357233 RepID=UPI003F568886
MSFRAVIFDLDGVITDTAHLHYQAWKETAAAIGITIDPSFNARLKGISRMASLALILRHGGQERAFDEAERARLAARKNARYGELLASLDSRAILPGIPALLDALAQHGIAVGLASVSLNAPFILDALGLRARFDYCVDASLLCHSKPDPEIFLTACAGLGVAPEQAIGIEDAQAGIDAINASGMRSVGIGHDLQGAGLLLPDTGALSWRCLQDFWSTPPRVDAPVN